jgi:Flp pilus assembly protein TadG
MTRAAASSFGFGGVPGASSADTALRPRGKHLRMGWRNWRAARCESGSAIVEFAMTSIILFTLVFGVMAIGLALYSYNVVAEAAREGSRYAIVRGSACNSFSNCNVTSAQIQTYVKGIGFPGINPASLTATAAWPTTGINCTPSITPCNNPGNLVNVTVNYQFPLVIPFVPSRTLTMSSTSAMVISQ